MYQTQLKMCNHKATTPLPVAWSLFLYGAFWGSRPMFYFFTHSVDGGGAIIGGVCPLGNQPPIVMRIF